MIDPWIAPPSPYCIAGRHQVPLTVVAAILISPPMDQPYFRRPPHQGKSYLSVMSSLHRCRRPATYLEIGTETGRTLALARCASIAIDPEFHLDCDVKAGKPSCSLYEMTSDAFFASHDPTALLGAPLDFAFIDGMHRYEFALRDFMNVERHCRPNSIIVLHDCLPVDTHMARVDQRDRQLAARAEHEVGWAGDTWKTIWILRRYRPDLCLFAFDAPPSGLLVVTNLDATSTVLRDRYDEAISAAMDISLTDYYAELEILPTSAIRRPAGFAKVLAGFRRFDFARFVHPWPRADRLKSPSPD